MAVLHVKTPTGVEKAYDLDHIVDIDPIADEDIQEKWDNIDPDTSIFTYAPLESPTFTGEPKAPTPNQNDSSTKVATTAFCKELVREHGGMPIGHEYFSMNPNIPEGSLPLFGGEYSRETYSDLWAWVQTQTGYCKTEAEWMALSASHNGNVPFYSDGDGSTTFRVPSLKCWVKGADGDITEVGSYLEAGLPNIEGFTYIAAGTNHCNFSTTDGAFKTQSTANLASYTSSSVVPGNYGLMFDASLSNSIYGKSETVQPESIVGLWLVRAYGAIVDIGQIDEKQYIDEKDALIRSWTRNIVAVGPGYYRRKLLPAVTKTTVTISQTWVNINDEGYISSVDTVLDLTVADSWDDSAYTTAANRAGKDFYIYACQPTSGTTPVFKLSANSTVPTGYTVSNSRKIGGFHCLCLSVGTISGHTLSGYNTGEILPLSVWDLRHRPVSDPEGMVWIAGIGKWVDIYLNSWNGSKLVSAYGATIADGESSKKFNGSMFAEYIGLVGKKLISYDEFNVLAKGSNEMTNIKNSADPGTAGGHVDTNNRRMISNYGCEDCCGVLWQWGSDLFETWVKGTTRAEWRNNSNNTTYTEGSMRYYLDTYAWQKESVYNPDFDTAQYGSALGLLRCVLFGGYWNGGASCGSRCANCRNFSAYGSSNDGCRGVSDPACVNL